MENDPSTAFFDEQPPPLYETLGLHQSAASEADIRKAYRRLALLSHPDKLGPNVSEKELEEKKKDFNKISFAYNVLNDPERRKRFDQTGRTDDAVLDPGEGGWDAYFNDLFDKVTTKSLDDFFEQYEGSAEEKQDIHTAYKASNGSIEYILEHVFSRDNTIAEERFTKIISESISSKELKKLKNWKPNDKAGKAKRQKKAQKEAKEAEKLAKELGTDKELASIKKNKRKKKTNDEQGEEEQDEQGDDEDGLRAIIQARGASRMSGFLSNLAAKYGADDYDETLDAPPPKNSKKAKKNSKEAENNNKKDSKKNKTDEPSEEDFAKAQAKILANKAASKR